MKIYRNTRTGAIIHSTNELKGEEIEEVKEKKKPTKKKEADNGKDND